MSSKDKLQSNLSQYERACSYFPGGVNSPVRAWKAVGGTPLFVDHGSGPFLYDIEGNRYVDLICSWGPLVLGHAHPAVKDALSAQLERGTSYGLCCEQESQLAAAICRSMPSIQRLRFVNSGTEAAMSVLRLARAYTGRKKIIKFAGCYHGHVDALLVEAGSGVATLGLPGSKGVPEATVNDTLTAQFNDLQSIQQLCEAYSNEIAAILVEPVMGNCSVIPPREGFLRELREVADACGAVLVFDEVMTGFRVAPGGAQEYYGVTPDLTMLGKVIGGGLPVGAFGGKKEIMEMLAPEGLVYQAGTLSGNPLAMAAGIATLHSWIELDGFSHARTAAEKVVELFRAAADATQIPCHAVNAGTMVGFAFSDRPLTRFSDTQTVNENRFRVFFHAMLDHGVLIAPSPYEAAFLSAVHDDETLDILEQAIAGSFTAVEATTFGDN